MVRQMGHSSGSKNSSKYCFNVLFLKNRNECKSSMMNKTLKAKKKGMINKSHTGV